MPRGLRPLTSLPMWIFGANTSDRVDLGAASVFELDPISVAMWVMPTTLTTQRVLWAVSGSTAGNRIFRLSGTSGDLQYAIVRATTNGNYTTSSTPLAVLNRPVFVGFSFNSAATGNQVRIVKGSLTDPVAECSYSSTSNGSGSPTVATGSTSSRIGNNQGAASAFQGGIGPVAVWNGEMTVADFEMWRRAIMTRMRVKGVWRLGEEPANARDYSGNGVTGTATGVTVNRTSLVLPQDIMHRLGRQPSKVAA